MVFEWSGFPLTPVPPAVLLALSSAVPDVRGRLGGSRTNQEALAQEDAPGRGIAGWDREKTP